MVYNRDLELDRASHNRNYDNAAQDSYPDAGGDTVEGDYADSVAWQRRKKIKIVLIVVVLGALVAGGLWAAGYLGAEKKEKKKPDVIAPARSVKKANAPGGKGTNKALKRPVAKPTALSAAITTKPDGRPVTQKPAGVADKSKKKSAKANKNRKKAKKDDA